jgi:hypothetical protein
MGDGPTDHAIISRIRTECEMLNSDLRRLILDAGPVIGRFESMMREVDNFAIAAFAGAAFDDELAQKFRDDVGVTEVCRLVCIFESVCEAGSEVTDSRLA